ncbi:MAG TPA: tripartite tricarboxylate transporter substrate-binding protein [Alphaproteobacteria bacterium]|jgi:tripartite-type tricarboxylate transporter receptor subunit TctC|nr:tripartite tricarboxylate transporter substrate-binding protein [Alphaproteobacteria bacterium]
MSSGTFTTGTHRTPVSSRLGWLSAAALAVALSGGAIVPRATADDFYKGKEVRLIVSTTPGGAYDNYARLLAPALAEHLPGHPTVIVQNMPGAGGLKTANYIYAAAPRDGTVIAGTHSSVPTAPLTTPEVARFDANKLSWIGSITSDPFVGYVWHTAPIKTLNDARTTEVIIGGISVGTAGVDYAILARDMFGLKLKIVTGYKGSNDVKLAMESGEVQGTFANGWTSLNTAQPDWLRDKKIRIIVQHGFKKLPELPDVPLLIDFAQTDADRQALFFTLARQVIAKPYFGPPELPAERLATLRRAFDDAIHDPKFVATGTKAGLSLIDPMTGEELAALVRQLSETPPSVIGRIDGMLKAFKK